MGRVLKKTPVILRVVEEELFFDDYDGSSPRSARETSPYRIGDRVRYDGGMFSQPGECVIVYIIAHYSQYHGEWMPLYRVSRIRKDGTPSRLYSDIFVGSITRGYENEKQ